MQMQQLKKQFSFYPNFHLPFIKRTGNRTLKGFPLSPLSLPPTLQYVFYLLIGMRTVFS